MKPTTIIVAAVIAIGAFVLFRSQLPRPAPVQAEASNVSIVDGKQIVSVRVKGGYLPGTSSVKAGMPTVLRFETRATYDCSSQVRIPSLGIDRILPPTGTTDIALGTLQPGTLEGTCGMGMYRFAVDIQG